MPKSLFFTFGLLLMLVFSVSAQTDPFLKQYQERSEKNLKDVDFTIKFKGDQTKFRQGEIIPLELRFSASGGDRYDFLNRTYDRSGRLLLDGFIIDRKEKTFDPLDDYFGRWEGLAGGGLYSVPALGEGPQTVKYLLNDYLSFKEPGIYRIYIISPRVSLKKKDGVSSALFGSDIVLASNVLDFEIIPADEKWQAEKLTEGVKNDCHLLRYLGTRAAAKEMLIRYGRDERSCEFDDYLGLIGSPERSFIVNEMERMLAAPDYEVTDRFFEMLLRLRHYLNDPKIDFTKTDSYAFEVKKENQQKNAIKLDYLEKLAKVLPAKDKFAFQTSLETFFSFHADGEKQPPAELTAAIISDFANLSKKTKWKILQNSLDKLRTPAMLSVLQALYDDSEKAGTDPLDFFYDKEILDQSIKGIYALDEKRGKQIILNELRRPQQRVETWVLTLLPPAGAPETEKILLEKLNAGNIPAADLGSIFSLVNHYQTTKLLDRLRELYAAKLELAECGAQIEFLKIYLKSDTKFGEEMLRRASQVAPEKSCLGANLANVIGPHWSSEIERIANRFLGSDQIFIAVSAAELLGKHNSAGAEEQIWKRLERFSKDESVKKDLPEKNGDSDSWLLPLGEGNLLAALSESPGWLYDEESNRRASRLCVYDICREMTEKMNQIFSAPFQIKASFDDENQITFSVNQYQKLSFEALKKKLEQFPAETTLTWISNGLNANDERNFQEIKEFVESRRMKLKSNE